MPFKFLLLFSFLTLHIGELYSQHTTDSIQIKRTNFIYKGERVGRTRVVKIMKSNPEAHALMKSANGSLRTGQMLAGLGGLMVWYGLGIESDIRNTPVLIAGIALLGISFPFELPYPKKVVHAVEVYNRGLQTSPADGAMIELGASGDGVGIKVIF